MGRFESNQKTNVFFDFILSHGSDMRSETSMHEICI